MNKPFSSQPRKQRKWQKNMPNHVKSKATSSTLAPDLRRKYKRRSIRVRKGDEVLVSCGQFKGAKGEVTSVDPKKDRVFVSGVNSKKSDGTDVPKPLHASNLVVTKLDLDDPVRRRIIERKDVSDLVE